ncbi:MAG: DUF378 domain-containing protein [Clostridia bacterium]|nr:DUF378 domain-containing protein [Clostridia bacterium]
MVIANFISYVLVLLGALNWGLYGLANFILVGGIFQGPRTIASMIVYGIIALAAIWLIISPIITGWGLKLTNSEQNRANG